MENRFLYNKQVLKERRRDLRNNQTKEERLLWSKIKNKQIRGWKFVRQYSVGPYILDFYCPKSRLAIELDGAQHRNSDAALYDKDRELYLQTLDIRTIRFRNNEVNEDVDKAISLIVPLLE